MGIGAYTVSAAERLQRVRHAPPPNSRMGTRETLAQRCAQMDRTPAKPRAVAYKRLQSDCPPYRRYPAAILKYACSNSAASYSYDIWRTARRRLRHPPL